MPVLSAHDVAAELRRRIPGLGKVKLHKLLYYCQGHHLATFGEPLFPEPIQAWDMGPVVSSLWGAEQYDEPLPTRTPLGNAELNTVGYVLSRYGALSGADLERLTHAEAPWRDANARRRPQSSAVISNEAIRAFFAASATSDDEAVPTIDSDVLAEWLSGARDVSAEMATDSLPRLRSLLVGDQT